MEQNVDGNFNSIIFQLKAYLTKHYNFCILDLLKYLFTYLTGESHREKHKLV